MLYLNRYVRASVLAAAGLLGAAHAANVVVTPGTNAGYMYFPSGITGAGGAAGPTETLAMCRVTPTNGSRTLTMSTRNWFGYSKPITVYYKMVGGGAGYITYAGSAYPQFQAAGGSTIILKNGGVVGYAPGMNSGATSRNIVSGSFTVTNADTLSFILGGGGGGGLLAYQYTYTGYDYYAFTGGGGAGYYGGGAGNWAYQPGSIPAPGAAVATGGTNTAGGTGGGNGALYTGGRNTGSSYNAPGGSGTTSGANVGIGLWSGYMSVDYQIGGGGGQGKSGNPGGQWGCLGDPDRTHAPPIASSFDLSDSAGLFGNRYIYTSYGTTLQCNGGGGYGEIVLQYQAPTCDLIPQYNQN